MDSIKNEQNKHRYDEYDTETAIGVAHSMAAVSGLLAATSLVLSFRSGVRFSGMPSVFFGKQTDLQHEMSDEFTSLKNAQKLILTIFRSGICCRILPFGVR